MRRVISGALIAALCAAWRPDAETTPDFASRPLRTFNEQMPGGFGVDEFVESWSVASSGRAVSA